MKFLPVGDKIYLPTGATSADLLISLRSVLRGGGVVAGGSFSAVTDSSGNPLTKTGGSPLQLLCAEPGDLVDGHPYAKVGVTYRGISGGYEFDVDLAVVADATSISLQSIQGTSRLLTPIQALEVQKVLAAVQSAEALPGLMSEVREHLEVTGKSLVYHLPNQAPPGFERLATVDPSNFREKQVTLTVMGVNKTFSVVEVDL